MTGEIVSSVLWVLLAQSTVCLAAGLVGSVLLRRRAARAHQILLTSLLAAVLMPATYLLIRHFEWGLLTPPVAAQEASVVESMPATEAEVEMAVIEVADVPAFVPVYEAPTPKVPWAAIALIGWAGASALLLGRLLLRFVLGLRLLRGAKPVDSPLLCEALRTAKDRIGMAGPVELRSTRHVRSPIIWCWRRVPALLVHEQPPNAKVRDWVGVFCHELAHWKRLDHASGLLAELLAAVLPWHPLTWWTRSRLSRLSEEVCDDWVLASGQVGVDYAESLLDLAPQSQLAFLPTVVGKERVMKTRIHRIVKDRCGNPTVGKWWTLAVSVMVIGIAASVALAQPGRPPREPGEPRPMMGPGAMPARNQALALEGRRNVLERMLDQLRDQARETEAALREQGDQPSEKRQILRAELAALRGHIQMTERQLQNLNQPQPVQPPRPMLERARRANERLLDLRAKAEQTRRELSEIDDPDGPRAQELRESLDTTQQEIRDIEVQLDRQRERVAAAREQVHEPEAGVQARQRQIQVMRQQQARREAAVAQAATQSARRMRVDQLQAETRKVEARVKELEEQGKGDGEESQALRNDLRIMRNELRDIRQAAPQEGAPVARARATQSTLSATTTTVRGAPVARARATAPQRPVLRRQRAQVQEQIAAAEQQLAQLENKNGDKAGQLRARLERLHLEMQRIDGETGAPQAAAPRRAAAGRPLETEIEQLRGQVNGLNEQMQQMQKLLEQLVAQKEATR